MLHVMRRYVLILGLCALSFGSGCSTAPRPYVRTDTVDVATPVPVSIPADLLEPCAPETFLAPDHLTVKELAQWAEDLAITIEAVCNTNLAAIKKAYATHDSPGPSGVTVSRTPSSGAPASAREATSAADGSARSP